MTNAEAVAALQADEQSAPDPGFAANPPVPEQAAPAAPEGQPAPESATLFETPAESEGDTFDGGKFNPDLLPDELQPGWKQLQAAFTQRTQELAEQRKQFE